MAIKTKRRISAGLVAVASSIFVAMMAFQNCSPGFQINSDMLASEQAAQATPELDLSANADLTNATDVTLTYAVSGVSSSLVLKTTCQLNDLEVKECAAKSITYSGLADGDYVFKVTVETPRGKKASASRVFRKDATKPVVAVSSMPSLLTNQVNTSFVFTSTDNLSGVAKTQCALDTGTFADCASPASLTALLAGAHTFKIQVTDKAGNKADLYSFAWTIDLSVPTVLISANPLPVTNQATASFTFAGTGLISYECDLDNAGFASCASPKAFTNLAEGNHTFKVRGTNGAGTVSSPAQYTWMIDLTPPTAPTIATAVTPLTTDVNASFSFSSTDRGSGIKEYQCSLDAATFATCTSSKAYSNLGSGAHAFLVKAIDNVGNVSTISTFNWTIDKDGPKITLTQTPNALQLSEVSSFAFTVTDNGGVASVQCRWTSGLTAGRENAFANCASLTASYELSPGIYRFEIEALDNVGNKSTLAYRWEVEDGVGTPLALHNVVGHQDGFCGFNSAGQVVCSSTFAQIPKVIAGFANAKQIAATYAVCIVTTSNTVRCNYPGSEEVIPIQDVPGLSNVAMVAPGTSSFCAVLLDGTARCWGSNDAGQLGDGTKEYRENPVVVNGLTGAVSISASYGTMCAIVSGGTVKCWGDGSYGQLGNGTNTSSSVPVSVTGITNAKQIIAGISSCALLNDGTVKCWGDFGYGSLGDGLLRSSNVPVTVAGTTRFLSIAGDGQRFCGLVADGSLSCWGELTGTYRVATAVPTDFGGFKDLTSLGGGGKICASHANGATRCMFNNWYGGLSSNSSTFSAKPARSPWIRNVASIATQSLTNCALGIDKTVSCWGFGENGQLGDGSNVQSALPVLVSGLANIKKVSAGSNHFCAITGGDTVKCWGFNYDGELGNGAQGANSNVPVDVLGLTGVKALAAGPVSCAIVADDTVKCWGNRYDPITYARKDVLTPIAINGLTGIKSISSGGFDKYSTCGVNASGRVTCWSLQEDVANVEIANLLDAKEVSVGSDVACALTSTGGVKCWGWNQSGSLGIGDANTYSNVHVTTAALVPGLESGVVKVVTSYQSVCALKSNGQVYCWGQNYAGYFGNGATSMNNTSPVLVATPAGVADISLSNRTLFFVGTDGRVSSTGQKFINYGGLTGVIKTY